jgi:hypothetical protein
MISRYVGVMIARTAAMTAANVVLNERTNQKV